MPLTSHQVVFTYTNIYYNMIHTSFRDSKSQGVLAFICRLRKNPTNFFFVLLNNKLVHMHGIFCQSQNLPELEGYYLLH